MKFIEFIQDPVNGFFTLLGAVILSMFGAFIKDGILKLFSHSSKLLKKKREKDIKERDLVVEQLVNSQPYLILYCTQTVLSNVMIGLMYLILLTVPTYLNLKEFSEITHPLTATNIEISSWSISVGSLFQVIAFLFLLFVCIVALILIYLVSKRNLIIILATKMIQASIKDSSSEQVTTTTEPSNSGSSQTHNQAGKVSNTDSVLTFSDKSRDKQIKKQSLEITNQDTINNKSVIATEFTKNGEKFIVRDGKIHIIAKPKNK